MLRWPRRPTSEPLHRCEVADATREEGHKMARVQKIAAGALAILALVAGSVVMAPTGAAHADGSGEPGSGRHVVAREATGPNCLTPRPCPPPVNQ